MRKRVGLAALFAFVVLLQLSSTEAAWAKPAPAAKAPPTPPPPPPSPVAQALAKAKVFAASAAAKLPSKATCQTYLQKGVAGSQSAARASLALASRCARSTFVLASKAGAASYKASSATVAHLSAQLRQSKFSAPANALSARLIAAVQKPLVSEPLAVLLLFAAFAYSLRSGASGPKLYARAALCTAVVNWLSFSFLVHCVTTAVVFVLTVLDLLAANPELTLGLCLAVNGREVLRVLRSYLPALQARRKTASFAAPPETPAVPRSAAPSPAPSATSPAARISASGTPDAAKKPGTPVPGAPKASPAARPAAAK